jgi:anti-sigma factor RsiW
MTAAPECEKVLLVQAELDGELDAAQAAALAAHRGECPVCQAAVIQLARARALIGEGLYEPMPEDLRARILSQIAAAAPVHRPLDWVRARGFAPSFWRRWWISATSFGVGAACAAAIALLVFAPGVNSLTEQVVAGHIRSLQPGHLEDVPSSDRHTVKPWFDGRIDFAPPVKDLAAVGFPLKGGRLDYLGGRPVAALVYQRDKHVINLFVWPTTARAEGLPEAPDHQGYNIVHWTANSMALWAVSDLEASQLREFAEEWRRSP